FFFLFFFFSSRRRHTRSTRDWSSDVCSSDLGQRPALLVIDVNYNFCGDRREPILESIKRWRNSCGAEAWDGVARIRELIDAAHRSEERRVGKEWRGERAKEQGNKKWTRQAET